MFTFTCNYRNYTTLRSFDTLSEMVDCITEMLAACPQMSFARI